MMVEHGEAGQSERPPVTLAKAVTTALEDAWAISGRRTRRGYACDPDTRECRRVQYTYEPDTREWHRADAATRTCLVCFAGMVFANRLGIGPGRTIETGDLGIRGLGGRDGWDLRWKLPLHAIEQMRLGRWERAAVTMHYRNGNGAAHAKAFEQAMTQSGGPGLETQHAQFRGWTQFTKYLDHVREVILPVVQQAEKLIYT